MTEYGPKDEDEAAYRCLLDAVKDKEVNYILHYARMPPNARACKLPGSLRVQAVLTNGCVITAFQAAVGAKPRIL